MNNEQKAFLDKLRSVPVEELGHYEEIIRFLRWTFHALGIGGVCMVLSGMSPIFGFILCLVIISLAKATANLTLSQYFIDELYKERSDK